MTVVASLNPPAPTGFSSEKAVTTTTDPPYPVSTFKDFEICLNQAYFTIEDDVFRSGPTSLGYTMPPVGLLLNKPLGYFEAHSNFYAGFSLVVENADGVRIKSTSNVENVVVYSKSRTAQIFDMTPNQVYRG